MNNKYTAMDVANYVVWIVNKDPDSPLGGLTPLKLQKILYYIATTYFKKFEKRLFPENFQKWQYGPVVKDVYYEFKPFGIHHIAKPKAILERNTGSGLSFTKKVFDPKMFEEDKDFIEVADAVVNKFIKWKAFDLVERTHEEDAWKEFESDIMKGTELIYSDAEFLSAKSINEK
ncbi:Panacea domain-containing protein [Acinetobacter bereziniae]|uniref:Panacea domain-containing protein n=1 Tax=Acinetobacter bereziniae TaxID=106648 RepID=UPI0021E4B280|nr:type II toxin-antitoxin system antitoxin SocA domain-containing protein [Acinetobacter bereziniae]MCV2445541.1 DUF4065 domain-containing protein [Acinetobacter bereziniae]